MLQYQSNSIVVVPPMQAVWLSQDNQQGRFCLSFDVKTDTDACVLFKPEPGSKRWQARARRGGRSAVGSPTTRCARSRPGTSCCHREVT